MTERNQNRQRSRSMAYCAMVTALGVVVMVVLGWTGIATYLGPQLAMLMLVSLQRRQGSRDALLVWLATGILSMLLLSDKEQAAVYLLILGWYPAVRPTLERLPKALGMVVKLLCFNCAVLVCYALLWLVMGAEVGGGSWVFGLGLAMLGNLCFLLTDAVIIPRTVPVLEERLRLR